MEEIKEDFKFQPERIQIVDIDSIRPNTWNPKDEDTKEFARVVASIQKNGLRMPVVVRENEGFEIIDGEQRWKASKKLGYSKILIYNEGVVTDQRAKELTIWYQQQVPFDEVKLSDLVKEMTGLYPDFQSPFTTVEVDEFIKVANFGEQPNMDFTKKNLEGLLTYSVTVTNEQMGVIEQALSSCIEKVSKEDGIKIEKPRATELICAEFMAS